jgi:prepilin-type N-terminal cleavage/methylation domain-containing protein
VRDKANPNNTGFTLVEAVIVVLIVGILAGIVIPKILSTTSFSATLAAEMAVTDIRATQAAAIFQDTIPAVASKTITFNGDNTYTVMGTTKTLPGGATADSYTITFNYYGEPTAGVGTFDITCGSDTETISIFSLTGKASIQ